MTPAPSIRTLSERYTRELLNRCTARELVVLAATFGIEAIANRMGINIEKLLEKTNSTKTQK